MRCTSIGVTEGTYPGLDSVLKQESLGLHSVKRVPTSGASG